MLLNDQSYHTLLFPNKNDGSTSSSSSKSSLVVFPEKRNLSMVFLAAAGVVAALFGGLLIGATIENTRVAHCSTNTSSDVWMCPAGMTPFPPSPAVVVVPASSAPQEATTSSRSTTLPVEPVAVEPKGPLAVLKPAVIEIGVLALMQAFGVRFLKGSLAFAVRKVPQFGSRILPVLSTARRVARKSAGGFYKLTKLVYKKTAASKVVTRTKKIVKNIVKKNKKKKYQQKQKEAEEQQEKK